MSQQSIKADKWDSLVAWLQKTQNEDYRQANIYEFLDECLGVNNSGEDTSIYYGEEHNRIILTCYKCEKKYFGFEGNCCCGECCSYCKD